MTSRRVVVTGMGAVTDVGNDVPTMWQSLIEGKSGISRITAFEQDDRWTVFIAGSVRDWEPTTLIEKRELKRMDRFCAMGLYAADEAARDCGVDFATGDPTRRGVVVGSGTGGIATIEEGLRRLVDGGPRKLGPFVVPKLMVNACAGNISIRFGLRGANSAIATACATGGHAIGAAYQMIQRGDVDLVFAGGSEAAVTPLCLGSFAAMKALSTRNDEPELASRPFDVDRNGFVLAEGAGIVVLEELEQAKARGARIYAEVLGFGSSGDAQHIAAPDENGVGAMAAMRTAMTDAGVALDQVDYINAHGTSTPLGDKAEIGAVEKLFGDHAAKLAMSSTKSMTGHTLGAAGGIESLAVILSVQNNVVPPTINLDNPETTCIDLVAKTAQERTIRYGLNNSFGFGGHNVSVCFGKYGGD